MPAGMERLPRQGGILDDGEYGKLLMKLADLPKSIFTKSKAEEIVHRWTFFHGRVKLVYIGMYSNENKKLIEVFVSSHRRLYDYNEYAKSRRRRFRKIWPWFRPESQQKRFIKLLDDTIASFN